ncbi:hypothetical protein [Actinoplanes sp. NPDC023714]|uniref:hypothetical protein n=1 Tax=Actinoplanes sp. NPDC023714 TaxID=3154322 RepID=UPI0033C32134
MADAYTVFWASHLTAAARTPIEAGVPLTVLFGGVHQSMPSFTRAKVTAGDLVYPIAVHAGTVFVLGRMRVADLSTSPHEHMDANPHWRFLAGTCMTEAVTGTGGTVLRLDAAMPVDTLRRLTYRSQRGTRTVKHLGDDGRLLRPLSLRGIYRLDAPCVADLDAVLAQPSSSLTCAPRSRRQERDAVTKAAGDAAFWRAFSN